MRGQAAAQWLTRTAVRELIDTALKTNPQLLHTAQDILDGRDTIQPLPKQRWRDCQMRPEGVRTTRNLPEPIARAKTLLQACLIAGAPTRTRAL